MFFCFVFQFAVLDHFYTHPYSIICNDYKEATNCVSNLTDTDLKHIRELPSFQNFLEKKENKESSPLKNNKDVKVGIYFSFHILISKCFTFNLIETYI